MRDLRTRPIAAALLLVAALASCGDRTVGPRGPALAGRTGVVEVDPPGPDFTPAAGQTIYVPAYSSVPASDRARPIQLSITVSVRNTDPEASIVVTALRYYDHDGRLIHDELRRPLRLGPRASFETFVNESDTRGGVSASFEVDWVADRPVSDPLAESVMISTANTQGIAFTCPGRVLRDRRPAAAGSGGEGP